MLLSDFNLVCHGIYKKAVYNILYDAISISERQNVRLTKFGRINKNEIKTSGRVSSVTNFACVLNLEI